MAQVDQDQIDRLVCEIKRLEEQLAQLRAKVERLGSPTPVRTVADLCGVLPELDLPEEEFEAVRYRLKWEGGDSEASGA